MTRPPVPPDSLALARAALGDRPAWLVGGTPRDRLLGRFTDDLDILVEDGVAAAARRLAGAARGAAFELSEAHGAWRIVGPGRAWQIDLLALRGGSLEADLLLRDFTVNAIAEPLSGGDPIDPTGGLRDLARRRLRLVAPASFRDDPLRVLRLARLACQLDFEIEAATAEAARVAAPLLSGVAAERVFAELKRLLVAPGVLAGLALLDELAITPVVLPELSAMRGVAQNRFHHRDVHGHTVEVLEAVVGLERDPGGLVGPTHAGAVADFLREPLADELDRGMALRLGALLHDVAKPQTRQVTPEGRVTFLGHDSAGAALAAQALRRLRASERLQAHVAALTRHHLRVGFLVHRSPLPRREVYRYLDACEPVTVDVTLLSLADRVATRGETAQEAIARHVKLGRELLGEALRWREQGRPRPLVRGDELARELGMAPGPPLGRLLAELAEAQYAGEIATREQALELARARAGAQPAGA